MVVEGATGQHLRSKCQLDFHSHPFRVRDSRCGRETELKRAGPGQGSMSGEQVRVPQPQAEQLKLEQQHGQVDSKVSSGQVDSKESSGQVILRHGPSAQVLRERERKKAYLNSHRTPDKTGEILQI